MGTESGVDQPASVFVVLHVKHIKACVSPTEAVWSAPS